jgi:hypothetical protein
MQKSIAMRTILRRLQKLEKTFVPAVVVEDEWGSLAELRDKLLDLAKPRGELAVAQLRTELDELGPSGLLIETVRCYLRQHGFVQNGEEGVAEMVVRALGINMRELRLCVAKGQIGKALLERFTEPRIASDIQITPRTSD